jgi:hypothetical protein
MKHIHTFESFLNENVLNEEWKLNGNKLMMLNPETVAQKHSNQEPTRYEWDPKKEMFISINYGSQGEEKSAIKGAKVDKEIAEDVYKKVLSAAAGYKFKTWQEADSKIKAVFKAVCAQAGKETK